MKINFYNREAIKRVCKKAAVVTGTVYLCVVTLVACTPKTNPVEINTENVYIVQQPNGEYVVETKQSTEDIYADAETISESQESRANTDGEDVVEKLQSASSEIPYGQGDEPPVEFLMISQEANDGDVVTFDPGKQLVYVRVTYPNCDITPSVGGLRVPDGYSIYFIEPVQKANVDGVNETIGYDAWFINNMPVEVTAVFDAYHGSFSFNTFGIPKEPENVKRY